MDPFIFQKSFLHIILALCFTEFIQFQRMKQSCLVPEHILKGGTVVDLNFMSIHQRMDSPALSRPTALRNQKEIVSPLLWCSNQSGIPSLPFGKPISVQLRDQIMVHPASCSFCLFIQNNNNNNYTMNYKLNIIYKTTTNLTH